MKLEQINAWLYMGIMITLTILLLFIAFIALEWIWKSKVVAKWRTIRAIKKEKP